MNWMLDPSERQIVIDFALPLPDGHTRSMMEWQAQELIDCGILCATPSSSPGWVDVQLTDDGHKWARVFQSMSCLTNADDYWRRLADLDEYFSSNSFQTGAWDTESYWLLKAERCLLWLILTSGDASE